MRQRDVTIADWAKSTYSNADQACVEVASVTHTVGIRDSKLGDQSSIIGLATPGWGDLVRHLKHD